LSAYIGRHIVQTFFVITNREHPLGMEQHIPVIFLDLSGEIVKLFLSNLETRRFSFISCFVFLFESCSKRVCACDAFGI
jgi:hypothetical protein